MPAWLMTLAASGGPKAFQRKDHVGIDRQDTLRRKLPDIADIRQFSCSIGKQAGAVPGDKPVFLTERIDDLGEGASDDDNAARLLRQHRRGTPAAEGDGHDGHGAPDEAAPGHSRGCGHAEIALSL